jgi:RHS repeat-associated protein
LAPGNFHHAETACFTAQDSGNHANCLTPWAQTFSYDPFGNLSKSGTQSFQPVYSITNQYVPFAGFTATYDANGNVTADPENTYSWDAYGRPVVMNNENLTYDALGRMVEQHLGSNYDEIAYTPAGAKLALMSGQTLVKAFVALPAGAQAVYTTSGGQVSLAYYRHADWLGSSRLASTPNRTMYADTAIAPFGETYAQAGATDVSYTGQNQDTVAGDYDFPDREYGSVSGRWPSPDPAGLAAVDPSDPQTWNRYAYVRNSPLDNIDPLGLDCWGIQESYYFNGVLQWQGIIASWCDGAAAGGYYGSGGGNDILAQMGLTPPSSPPPLTKEWCAQGLQMAGQTMAAVDTAKNILIWGTLEAAADANNIDPALLAAIGVRETGFNDVWQTCDDVKVMCATANGAGNFQIDLSPGTNVDVSVDCAFGLECSANVAANLLHNNMNFLSTAHPNFTPSQLTQATAATYNMGLGNPAGRNISGNPATIDWGTAPGGRANPQLGNYGLNILLLMNCFE